MSTSPRIARATLVMGRHDLDTIAAVHGRSLGLPAGATPEEVRAAVTAAVSALRARKAPSAPAAPTPPVSPPLTDREIALCRGFGCDPEVFRAERDRHAAARAADAARRSTNQATARRNLRAQADGLLAASGVTQVRLVGGGQ